MNGVFLIDVDEWHYCASFREFFEDYIFAWSNI
jgi:hypothetical protein